MINYKQDQSINAKINITVNMTNMVHEDLYTLTIALTWALQQINKTVHTVKYQMHQIPKLTHLFLQHFGFVKSIEAIC